MHQPLRKDLKNYNEFRKIATECINGNDLSTKCQCNRIMRGLQSDDEKCKLGICKVANEVNSIGFDEDFY